tara:strand:- start:958 stop:1350 length:393 start_codon:yes stop_codon:yes gene_type:complete
MRFYKVDKSQIIDDKKTDKKIVFFTNRTVALAEARKSFRRFKQFTKAYRIWYKKSQDYMKDATEEEVLQSPHLLTEMPISEFGTHGNGGIKVVECDTSSTLTSKNVLLSALNNDSSIWETESVIWEKSIA